MTSRPPAYTTPASLSRSKTSRDDIQSLAEELLRSSMTRGVSSATSSSTNPPSYRSTSSREHSTHPASSASHLGFGGPADPPMSSHRKSPLVSRPPVVGSGSSLGVTSLTREQLRNAKIGPDGLPRLTESRPATTQASSSGTASSTLSSGLSAAEAKHRVRQLQREMDRASADAPRLATTGLFKKACSTDLLFLVDTTGSMGSYIEAAKDQIRSIVKDIKDAFLNKAEVRVAVVGYKDHGDSPNIQFLDFTSSAERVRSFLDELIATGGDDCPEDILGGIRQAINASWKQQSRCLVHIADAPPHGRTLHDLSEYQDNYINPGSEPHKLLYEPLLKQLVQLNINYALLRINSYTNRMAFAFSSIYAEASADINLLPANQYKGKLDEVRAKASQGLRGATSSRHTASAALQFEELELGTTYSALRHLVVKTVTGSASRTASRLTSSLSRGGKTSAMDKKLPSHLGAIVEDEDSGGGSVDVLLETVQPQWDTPGWLDETLKVEGFCPDMVVHSGDTLNDMMASDENIKLGVAELTIYARSKPFAQGALRVASYARTACSSNRFVAKTFKEGGKGMAHLAEDMRAQALCKAFALEFNALLGDDRLIDFDFIVTTCLQGKAGTESRDRGISLEPFIEGEYVKYNSNSGYVRDDPDDQFNQAAQAFSHFTFERTWGSFMVTDLQGVGHQLTDPAIQTKDSDRFKLSDANLGESGFMFFFATHECNSFCRKLELKSNKTMMASGRYEFRERWPSLESTVCCSNKLCRKIIRLTSAHKSDEFPGHHWCDGCWPQLNSSKIDWICHGPGPTHEFDVSKFFYESQGQAPAHRCPEHRERDTTISTSSVVGGGLYSKMKSANQKKSIVGRSW
ncbi:hypothetical protein GGR54DRAFT_58358 [Hypoxylon sp. NC1633]|nr:hypothetical protein GGR54DRAFT_58358 [Hypoxylon sp. NC1633]